VVKSNQKGLVSGGIGFASRAVTQLLLFGVTIVATRILSIEAFGYFALASLFLVLSRSLFYVGPYEYLLKSREQDSLRDACFSANIVIAIITEIGLCGFYFVSPYLFGTDDVSNLIAILAPSIFLVAATTWYEATLLRELRVQRYYVCNLLGDCVGAVAAVVLLSRGFGVLSLVAQTYARLGTMLIFYRVQQKSTPKLMLSHPDTRDVLRWSRPRYVAVLLNFTSSYGADLVLGALLSPAATGLYRASNRIVSSLTDLFAQPLQKIAQTNLSAQAARGEAADRSWLTMLAGVGAIAWAALVALAVLAPNIVPYALGEKWAAAVPVVVAFCVVKSFTLLDAVTTSFLVSHDWQREMMRVQIGVAILVVCVSAAAAPFGPVAVAIAVGCVTISMSLIYGTMVMRLSHASKSALLDLAKTAAPPAIGVAIALYLLRFGGPPARPGLPAMLVEVSLAATGFFIGVFLARRRILTAIGTLGTISVVNDGREF
jgi:O-antigen/teichoic acid export membrane protein